MGNDSHPDRLSCTCMALDPLELLSAWTKRLTTLARRRALRGCGLDVKRAQHVAALIVRLQEGPESFPEGWQDPLASCHLRGCPWRRSGRR